MATLEPDPEIAASPKCGSTLVDCVIFMDVHSASATPIALGCLLSARSISKFWSLLLNPCMARDLDWICPYMPCRALWLSVQHLPVVLSLKDVQLASVRTKAFSALAPTWWNKLPMEIRTLKAYYGYAYSTRLLVDTVDIEAPANGTDFGHCSCLPYTNFHRGTVCNAPFILACDYSVILQIRILTALILRKHCKISIVILLLLGLCAVTPSLSPPVGRAGYKINK